MFIYCSFNFLVCLKFVHKKSVESILSILSILTVYIWDLGQLVPYALFDHEIVFGRHLSTA